MTIAPPRVAPGPRGTPLLGSLGALQRDILGTLLDGARAHGGVARFRTGPWWFYLVSSPEGVKRVLVDNARGYRKSSAFEEARPILGEGLVTSEGEAWRRQRKLVQPAFHRERIAGFAATMVEEGEKLVERWRPLAASGATVDGAREMGRVTLAIVGRTLFGVDPSGEADALGAAITYGQEHASGRLLRLVKPPRDFPTPANLRFRRAVATLEAFVYRLIAERRASGRDEEDLLGMLMAARDEATGAAMTDREVRDEVMTLLLAGHDTTANTLAWTWYLLARNPAAEARLHAELDATLGGRAPAFADLPRLDYARRVVEESMRLYPAAWIVSRNASAEDVVEGYRIPKDAFVALSPFVTHRLPAYWEDPETFDPDRFLLERAAARERFAYFPFGAGPRQCIGNQFALTEAVLLLATIARRYRVRLAPGVADVAPEPLLTLRPRGGLPVVIEARGAA